jgi:flagellar protein FliO/FliZ
VTPYTSDFPALRSLAFETFRALRAPFFGTWHFGLFTFAGRVPRPASITSVTRWLLVVVGCAVLATAQPMSAAPESAPAADKPSDKPAAPTQIIYPKNSPERPAGLPVEKSPLSGMLVMVTAIALAATGAWILIQRRQSGPLSARGQRKLHVEETRPLGNRQYLVVAQYEGKKFLLGVTPGQIALLTPLETAANVEDKKA